MAGLFGGGQHTSTTATKLNALRIQTATYGGVVPIPLGTTRVGGNLIDYIDFLATPHTTTQQTGKGGGSSSSNTEYTYNVAVCIGIGEGPVSGTGKVWVDKDVTTLAEKGLTLVQDSQWSYMLTKHPERALPYYKFAYLAGYIDLGNSDSVPNISTEVKGLLLDATSPGGLDCAVTNVFTQMLVNTQWGLSIDSSLMGDWTSLASYCKAAGIWFSHLMEEAVAVNSLLEDMIRTCNAEFVCSEGKLKVASYCDTSITNNGNTFTPNNTIQYYLNDDAFIATDDAPSVEIKRTRYDDTYNSITVEIYNRARDYNTDAVEWSDPADVLVRGVVAMPSLSAHWITNRDIAMMVARLMVWRSLYNRKLYCFTLPYKYYLLEPMDIVAITDPTLGLVNTPVRIKKIVEGDNGLEMEAEDVFTYNTSPVYSSSGSAAGTTINNNLVSPSVNPPVIILASPNLTATGAYEIWVAISGPDTNWGGCNVWASYDNTSFRQMGTIRNPARHGLLTADLAAGAALDNTNTLGVSIYTGQILSGTAADRDGLRTLMYVDGELISYQTATLTGTNRYNLTSLKRGIYGSVNAAHATGTKWARLDDNVFKQAFDMSKNGQVLYLKFTSFNVFNANEQPLDQVVSYPFLASPSGVDVVSGLSVSKSGTTAVLKFSPPWSGNADVWYRTKEEAWNDITDSWNSITESFNNMSGSQRAYTYWNNSTGTANITGLTAGLTYTFKVVGVYPGGVKSDFVSSPTISITM